jgi:hypothetical protein
MLAAIIDALRIFTAETDSLQKTITTRATSRRTALGRRTINRALFDAQMKGINPPRCLCPLQGRLEH